MTHKFAIIQLNQTTIFVNRNNGRGEKSVETIVRRPGHVIATHNTLATCEKHLEKIRRFHPGVEAQVVSNAPPISDQ